MNTYDAFKKIVYLEQSFNVHSFNWSGHNMWPLLRSIIWFELIFVKNDRLLKLTPFKNFLNKTILYIKRKFLYFRFLNLDKINFIFFSRPTYLEKVGTDFYIDRIVDPVIDSLDKNTIKTKFYLGDVSFRKKLIHPYIPFLLRKYSKKNIFISNRNKIVLQQIEKYLEIKDGQLLKKYTQGLKLFISWFDQANNLFKKTKHLKKIYVVSWYFPDMMGICAAANKFNIKTVDLQHGKQGKYNAMYSGWTRIPNKGYSLMPDFFSCWGQPSCDHILNDSVSRKKHIPFVGGYPFLKYWLQSNAANKPMDLPGKKIKILFTLQPPQGDNKEYIPKFIINFLNQQKRKDLILIFKMHPNATNLKEIYLRLLSHVDPELYCFSSENDSLYDLLSKVTHHITAYSSCCHEASIFNVPSLIFGLDGKKIYEDEIKNGVFSYTSGCEQDIKIWLRNNHSIKKRKFSYIEYR